MISMRLAGLMLEGWHGGRDMQTMKWMGLFALAMGISVLAQEQMASQRQRDLLVDFARRRQQQMLAAATEQHLEVPKLFKELFRAVIRYDWPATSNLYFKIKSGIGQYAGSHSDPAMNNELWHYVLETFGAFEQVALWNPVTLQRYEDEIVRPLTTNCIYFGGTDPGRFVPTFLRETSPKPFHVITQNALADGLYMNYLRKSSDLAVLQPTPEQCNEAFRQFVEDAQAGRHQSGAEVRIKDGRVSVEGIQGVMMINGIIYKWIYDKYKDKHEWYVEESYFLPWMYPYLRPTGVILKLEKEPVATPQQDAKFWQQLISKDFTSWDQLLGEFHTRPEFKHDHIAQRAFSKLRCASAGVYEFRGIVNAAETAYQQAVAICPESPEASFRLANLYMRLNRADDAIKTLRKLSQLDPANAQAREALKQFEEIQSSSSTDKKPTPADKLPLK